MTRYKIVTTGDTALGYKLQEVADNLRRLCKYDTETLKKVLCGSRFTFKTGLDAAAANRYKAALDKTGIVCEIVEDVPELKIEMARPDTYAVSHHPNHHTQRQAIMSCPKCGAQQPKRPTCEACGIVIDKYNQRLQQNPYPEYVEPVAYADEETSGGGSLGGFLFKLALLVVLCVGGYFGYTTIFKESREVTVYTVADCEPCTMAIDYLKGEGIACTVRDVDAMNNDEKIAFVKLIRGHNKLPLVFVGDIRIDGYKPAMLQVAAAHYNGTLKDDGKATVEMYCRDGCGFCKKAARFLDENKVPYTNYDLADPANYNNYMRLQGVGTPLILINGTVRIDGFDKEALTMALEETGLL